MSLVNWLAELVEETRTSVREGAEAHKQEEKVRKAEIQAKKQQEEQQNPSSSFNSSPSGPMSESFSFVHTPYKERPSTTPLPVLSEDAGFHMVTPELLGMEIEGSNHYDDADWELLKDCRFRVLGNVAIGLIGAPVPIWLTFYKYRYQLERMTAVRRRIITASLAVFGSIFGHHMGSKDCIHQILYQNRVNSTVRRDLLREGMAANREGGMFTATAINKLLYMELVKQRRMNDILLKYGHSPTALSSYREILFHDEVKNELKAGAFAKIENPKYYDGDGYPILL